MTVLALDLAITATGICDDAGHSVYHPTTTGERRLRQIRNVVLDHVDHVDPLTLVAMEDCLVRTPSAAALGMLHGAIRVALMDYDIPYLVASPATLKIYATGSGRADKADMRVALLQRTGMDIRDDNAVDARWLWYLTHDLLGDPQLKLPQTHRRALDKLTLPEGVTA